MSDFVLPAFATPSVTGAGTDQRFPVHRIYCVGRNYPDKTREIAHEIERVIDAAKAFDGSAPVGAIRPATLGHVSQERIWLSVNGELRQEADVRQMLCDVPQIIAELSTFYQLKPGDLIFCATPAGVGPVKPGDRLEGGIEGLEVLRISIAAAERAG